MSRKTLRLDGLWYCLCPTFNLTTLSRPGFYLIKGQRSLHTGIPAPAPAPRPRRRYSTRNSADAGNTDSAQGATEKHVPATYSYAEEHKSSGRSAQLNPDNARPPKYPTGSPMDLSQRSNAKLESMLRELTVRTPKIRSTSQILRILVRDRGVRPEVRHYRALILANTDAGRGSPQAVRGLISEMEANGIPADSGTLHAALQVLAVHPDYLLRQEILQTLRDRWLPLSPAGWHYVVAGLLRESQFELALDHVAQMERKDIVIEDWLHSLLIYNLCEFGEFDEILQLMQSRVGQGHNMSLALWRYVLDVASAAFHYETTSFVWAQIVQLGYLKPSLETCANVLTVASRGDTDLAASVVRFLADNDVPLGLQDYEKLVKAHANAGNVTAAFEVLCSAHKAGIVLQDSSARPLLPCMVQQKISPRDAWNLLKQLKTRKHDIPRACANVVLELCEHDALDDPFAVDDGVDLYKELYSLCPEGADVSIYNTLISMSRRAKNRNVAMFLVKEMASLGVVPNAATFERLILMCLDAGNFKSAYLYFEDMQDRGLDPDEQARAEIRDKCIGAPSKFAVRLKCHPKISLDYTQAQDQPANSLEHEQFSQKPSGHKLSRPKWMIPDLPNSQRRYLAKERRKAKRRAVAIARTQEEEDWMDYEPGGLEPEVKLD